MNKTILIASFIFPERIDWFLSYLEAKFNITKNKVFCYENLDDNSKVIITFKITVPNGETLNFKDLFPNAVILHKKGNALYTINALNKLIDEKFPESKGNTNYKDVKIDWSEYQDKMITINGETLSILNISRLF
jgi:hypothetical protein